MYCRPVAASGPRAPAAWSTSSWTPTGPSASALPRRDAAGCPCPAWSARTAVAARLPAGGDGLRARASGWRSTASRGSASWPCVQRGPAAAPAGRPPRGPRRRGRRRHRGLAAGRCGTPWPRVRHSWSSGTSTRSTGSGCARSSRALERQRRPATAARRGSRVTLSRVHDDPDTAALLRLFPSTVELPPLRHHIEDLHALVPFFLARLSPSGQPEPARRRRCSS